MAALWGETVVVRHERGGPRGHPQDTEPAGKTRELPGVGKENGACFAGSKAGALFL